MRAHPPKWILAPACRVQARLSPARCRYQGHATLESQDLSDWARSEAAASAAAGVAELTLAAFAKAVKRSDKFWVVAFTARGRDWCPHCNAVEGALRKLAGRMAADYARGGKLSGRLAFGVVDCESAGSSSLCSSEGMGRPYSWQEGNFPQVLGYPSPSSEKAAPVMLLAKTVTWTHEHTVRPPSTRCNCSAMLPRLSASRALQYRLEVMEPVLRAALHGPRDRVHSSASGRPPEPPARPPVSSTWTKHIDSASGRPYWHRKPRAGEAGRVPATAS